MTPFAHLLQCLTVGESILLHWAQCPKGYERPKAGAKMGFNGLVFTLTPEKDGIRFERVE